MSFNISPISLIGLQIIQQHQ